MRAKDIMSTPVITASRDTHIKRIAELLVKHDISAVPIVTGPEEKDARRLAHLIARSIPGVVAVRFDDEP